MSKKYKYSVITFIFGKDYEILREPTIPDPDAEYICVTDNPKLKSENWKIIVDDQGIKSDINNAVIKRVYKARDHFMDYCSTKNCFRIDGSIEIIGSLKTLLTQFENYDLAFCVHPNNATGSEEYDAWIKTRNLNPIYKEKYLNEVSEANDMKIQLIETKVLFSKNNENTRKFWRDFYDFYIKSEKFDDRVDQIWLSYFLYKYEDSLDIAWFTRNIYNLYYFKMCAHGVIHSYATTETLRQTVLPKVKVLDIL